MGRWQGRCLPFTLAWKGPAPGFGEPAGPLLHHDRQQMAKIATAAARTCGTVYLRATPPQQTKEVGADFATRGELLPNRRHFFFSSARITEFATFFPTRIVRDGPLRPY